MRTSAILDIIFDFKVEMESLIAITRFLNSKYHYIGIELVNRADVKYFLEYTKQKIRTRNLTIYHNCVSCRTDLGMCWSWVAPDDMRLLDIINFVGTRVCQHEFLSSIVIQNNAVRITLKDVTT